MPLQIRRGLQAEVDLIVPLEGEPIYVTDQEKLVIGDGFTVGGIDITANLQDLQISSVGNTTTLFNSITSGTIKLINGTNNNNIAVSPSGTVVTGPFTVTTASVTVIRFADGTEQTTADTANPDQSVNTTSNVRFNSAVIATTATVTALKFADGSIQTTADTANFDQQLDTTSTVRFKEIRIGTETTNIFVQPLGPSGVEELVLASSGNAVRIYDHLSVAGIIYTQTLGQIASNPLTVNPNLKLDKNITFSSNNFSDIGSSTATAATIYANTASVKELRLGTETSSITVAPVGGGGTEEILISSSGGSVRIQDDLYITGSSLLLGGITESWNGTSFDIVPIAPSVRFNKNILFNSDKVSDIGSSTATAATVYANTLTATKVLVDQIGESGDAVTTAYMSEINATSLEFSKVVMQNVSLYFGSSTATQTIQQWAAGSIGSVKLSVHIKDGANIHFQEISVINNTTNINKVEYAVNTTNGELGTFGVVNSGGLASINFTPTSPTDLELLALVTLMKN